MGLKSIGYGPFKTGKSVFGLTPIEFGNLGLIDTEYRHQWYTVPHPTAKPGAFPFNNPRAIRLDNEMVKANAHLREAFEAGKDNVIYLVQTTDLNEAGRAVVAFNQREDVFAITVDSGSIMWDLLQDTRDTSDPKTAMLAWEPVKRFDRRFRYALMHGNKHAYIVAHAQEKLKKVGGEFVTDKIVPWLEKKSPHWADIVFAFVFQDGAPAPVLVVAGEGIGGAGGLCRGAQVKNPTFGDIIRRTGDAPNVETSLSATEAEYRNQRAVQRVASSPPIEGVD